MNFLEVLTQKPPTEPDAKLVCLGDPAPLITGLPKGFKPPRKHKRTIGIPKMTEDQAREILRLSKTGMKATAILDQLQLPVGYAAVWSVVTRRTWKHL